MSIYFYSYPSLHINRGGPAYKTEHLARHLSLLGADIKFFDMWDGSMKFNNDDLFYVFTANVSTYPLTVNLEIAGIRYIVNPIFFSNHSAKLIKIYRKFEKLACSFFARTMSDYDYTEKICRGAELIIPNTRAEGELLNEALDLRGKKFKVIENGVEKRFADADPDLFVKKHGLKDFVLYVGHLGSFRKNGLNILKAMQKIDAPCVVIADMFQNDEGRKCREIIETSKNIHYLGWVDHDDPLLASAYAACHTFILPTRYETPGRAALEAGLAGANVVITPKGGTKEYFKDLAMYPDPLDYRSIIEKIELSLNNNKTEKLRDHILQNFIWEKIAEKTWDTINEII